ncbi:MAG: septum formation initiator family protein [Firmicutes bacterium]|nr:septum formation initiator family protein [Bacillota bacterium]
MTTKKSKVGSDKIYTALTAIVIAFALFIGYKFAVQYLHCAELAKEYRMYEQQLASTEAEYLELCEQEKLLHDDAYIEYIARKNLGMVMAGEKLVYSSIEADVPELDKNMNVRDYTH